MQFFSLTGDDTSAAELDKFCYSLEKPEGPIFSSSNILTFVFTSDFSVTQRGYFISLSPGKDLGVSFIFNMMSFVTLKKIKRSIVAEEVHTEQITAGVEPQHVVISSDDVTPLASYVVSSSVQGMWVEVIIEDGSTNSSQMVNNSRLCRNVEVWHNFGKVEKSEIPCTFIAAIIASFAT